MEKEEAKKRQKIVKEELKMLFAKNYIQENVYDYVLRRHKQYYDDLHAPILKSQKQISKSTVIQSRPKKQVKIPKPKRTAQEVRERNITWSLSIGVIFLLIAGAFLATSTWDLLSSWMKTGMIALVSLLFFGLAIFTERTLKIKKTAFSFYVLGSLFLPIIILAIGFFGQLGSYLSINGEGRFLFGALGSLLLIPIYFFLAKKLTARLFVWFMYVTMTLFASFLIASFHFNLDGFYLGIMIYNSLLVILYKVVQSNKRFELFNKELLAYIQANVILSTLLLLVFYSNEVAYGINLILTALIYLAMIYVTNQKNYHFIFTAMLVYGAYQLIEFSVLMEIGPIAYALLGFIFLAIPKLTENKKDLSTIFSYTSAVISGLAFLFISAQGIFLRMDQPSIVFFIAYVLIAINFTYLANNVKKTLFCYLSPLFLMTALFEGIRIGQNLFEYDSLVLPMFFAACGLYIVFGCFMKLAFFQSIKSASRDIATIIMFICIFLDSLINHWGQVGVMMLFISATALLMTRYEEREFFIKHHIATWIHPLALGMAVTMFYAEIYVDAYRFGNLGALEPIGLIIASIIVLVVSAGWKQFKKVQFYEHAFFVSQGFYILGMVHTFHFFLHDFNPTIRMVIFFGGIAMAYLLYRKTKWTFVPYIISGVTLVFYFTALYALHENYYITSEVFHSLQLPLGALVLLVVGSSLKAYDKKITNAFWWVGHVYFPFALLFVVLIFEENTFWSVLLATVIYGLSLKQTNVEWKVKAFLYGCFTSAWLTITHFLLLMDLKEYTHYAWLVSSVLLSGALYWSSEIWKKRIIYYVIPFSVIGLIVFTFVEPFTLPMFCATIFYSFLILVLMRRIRFDFLKCIPLFFTFIACMTYSAIHPELEYLLMLLLSVGLLLAGQVLYRVLYQTEKNKLPMIDWYTIYSFVGFLFLYTFAEGALWEKLLPGLLISLSIYLQRKRIPLLASKWIFFFAIVYLLEPYYTLLHHIQIHELIRSECIVLPWIALAVLLKRFTAKEQKKLVMYIQWFILILAALILIQDAQQSGTIYDALILGTLALVAMLGGMAFRLKAFFFVGAGVLLFNLFLQTRPFWGSVPWWGYLLVAGTILITVASYNEWHKQKTAEGKETFITILNKKVIQRMKKWD